MGVNLEMLNNSLISIPLIDIKVILLDIFGLKEYDLKSQKAKSHGSTQKKRLLSNLPSNKKKNDAMVQPPPNVYLCDKCDDEFLSFREVQAHEKHCKGNSPSTPPMPSPDPEDLEEEVLDPAEQVPFLSYFGLQPAEHTGVAPYTSPRKRHQYILSRTKYGGRLQMPENYVTRYERHIRPSESDLVNLRDRNSNRWIVVYRPRKDQQWIHKYCFNSVQKREKMLAVQTGLDRRSRVLLASCQKVQLRVKLKRLAKKVVDRYTRRGGSSVHVPCIDLTDAEDFHDGPMRRLTPSSSSLLFSSLSTPFYLSPNTCLPNAATSSKYLPEEIAASGTYLNINSLIPSGTDIEANYFDNCAQNCKVDGSLADPLEISETNITNSYINSFPGKPPPSVTKIQSQDYSRSYVAPPEVSLPFLSKNTQSKISTLSNNGVTVTSIVNSDFPQFDSSSLGNFNAIKSHSHQANSKNNSSTSKLKPSISNCSSASNKNGKYDSQTSSVNSSFSNHSQSSKFTSSGVSNSTTNSNYSFNKKENVSLVEVIELSSDE
ncbi:hypothetical protein Avbf_02962 [Armadillidium vulgare]|nr:hypothetical protein Avbf_02962 [Armadillidium vulgare]